jgi:hypothetical protein
MRPAKPVQTLQTMVANLRNRRESRNKEQTPHRTAHLFATARKKG